MPSSLCITTVADRPDLAGRSVDAGPWPAFMRHNRVSAAYFAQTVETFPDTCLIATAPDGSVVGDAHAVQLAFGSELPAGGWEQAVVQAFSEVRRGSPANAACALNISVAQTWQGQGVAALLLAALRDAAARLGLADLYAPVRPTTKHLEPRTPMREYASRVRGDGLPADPWLRTHVRAGGLVVGIAPASWVVAGSLDEWREWTGLPFDRTGPVEVPGALSLVDCSLDEERATYVEANVWVRHRL
jgi:GNAT superfamily N-acetyltransferase